MTGFSAPAKGRLLPDDDISTGNDAPGYIAFNIAHAHRAAADNERIERFRRAAMVDRSGAVDNNGHIFQIAATDDGFARTLNDEIRWPVSARRLEPAGPRDRHR